MSELNLSPHNRLMYALAHATHTAPALGERLWSVPLTEPGVVADTLAGGGFAWETSCRVDQVVRPDRDRAWHVERGHLWRGLVERGLRRCLFGVESGVTSILERFNKETTGAQNALAIRTLTALGVPPRFTYITFDHLMTETELRATYAFQGRSFIERAQNAPVMQGNGIWHSREFVHMNKEVRKEVARGVVAQYKTRSRHLVLGVGKQSPLI